MAMMRYLVALSAGVLALPAQAQQVSVLSCQGDFMGGAAVVQGQRYYSPHNALGDGYVQFNGVLQGTAGSARMRYEGYTRVGAFEGVLQAPQGTFPIAVIDATGDAGEQMIIYQGGVFVGAPPTLGQLVCQWR
jgi:hypothetical protein